MLIASSICQKTEYDDQIYHQIGVPNTAWLRSVYWKCVCVLFATSKFWNPGSKHVIYCNLEECPSFGDFHPKNILRALGVEYIHAPFTYRPDSSVARAWGNCFHKLNVYKSLAHTTSSDTSILYIEADCIVMSELDGVEAETNQGKTLLYSPYMDRADAIVDPGLLLGHQNIYRSLCRRFAECEKPLYRYGGEFIAGQAEMFQKIIKEIDQWFYHSSLKIPRLKNGESLYDGDEYFMSFIYNLLQISPMSSNSVIKRVWTDKLHYCNVDGSESQKSILHLPSEKQRGLLWLYDDFVVKRKCQWPASEKEQFREYLLQILDLNHQNSSIAQRLKLIRYNWFAKKDRILKRLSRLGS